jgi:poly(hydroxyalkanoate) granule-associated protein
MAKLKKSARKTAGNAASQDQAERLAKSISESAQQIWLAGVGAFSRAQAEGSKMFEGLVKEGLGLEQSARKLAGGQADAMRDAVESKVGQARERAADTWDRLEKVFEDRVQRALVKLGVPSRDDLTDLSERVNTLTSELRKQGGSGGKAAKTTSRKAPAKTSKTTKTPAKAARKKTAARKSAPAKKTGAKRARKSTV